MSLTLRLAVPEDLPALRDLMQASIGELLKPFLPPDAVAASFDIMGLDSQLIIDGTYFVVEDDGVGFARRKKAGDGMGLHVMQHRAVLIGARLEVEPGSNHGVRITCTLPKNNEIKT